jgi:outer membrane protein assembly factor BamE (lipoprotein component of BamABCDE complex)
MKKVFVISAAVAALITTSGCSQVRGHQGYIADQVLLDAIKPGVDNRESVTKTLGRPTFTGQFDANDWYYVTRETRQLAFSLPKAKEQTIFHVRFDDAGNVATVDKSGAEKIASISPVRTKTPTLGKNRSFFEELFGNIGQVGSVGKGGTTADNPDGGN